MKIAVHLDYQRILANQAMPIHFALQFQAPHVHHARPKPSAFCIVLDRSGSMNGVPLQRAKEAAQVAIKNLRPDDLFGLVVFESSAQTVIPLQIAKDKQAMLATVASIDSAGSTNLTGGWMLGRDELRKAPEGVNRRALLLSDGLLNLGVVDPQQVRLIVSEGLEHDRVRTACLGFGDNYNEELMTALAHATGGDFYDAVSPEKFPAIFAAELEGLQRIAVQNLRVRFKLLDFCDNYSCLGEYPVVSLPDGRREYALGDLVSGEERVVVFALSVLPLPAVQGQPVVSLEGENLLEVEIAYDELTEDAITSKTEAQVIRIQQTQDPVEVKVNAQAIPWVALQRAGQVMKSVNAHMDAGRGREAVATLQTAIDALKRYGAGADVAEAVQKLESLIAQLQEGCWGSRERKDSHYYSASVRHMKSSRYWSSPMRPPSVKPPPPPVPPPPQPQPPQPPQEGGSSPDPGSQSPPSKPPA